MGPSREREELTLPARVRWSTRERDSRVRRALCFGNAATALMGRPKDARVEEESGFAIVLVAMTLDIATIAGL
jgi:hypothetical protein